MSRLARVFSTIGVVLALALAATPMASGGGPENGLGAICEHQQGGTWNSDALTCSGRFSAPKPARAICEHALDGLVFMMASPTGPAGWGCEPDQL